MKKSTFWKLMLIILPILAVGLATTPDSVTVFDTQLKTVAKHSYFELIEGAPLQMAMPLAAALSGLTGVFAAVYMGKKKAWCLKAILWTGFLSAALAALPVLSQGTLKFLPHPLLPILMLAEAVLSYIMSKKSPEEADKAPRLSAR